MSDFQVMTDWYPGTTNPERVGLYLVEFWRGHAGALLYWNGASWLEPPHLSLCPELLRSRWRGLAFDPQEAFVATILDPTRDVYASVWVIDAGECDE